MTSATTSRLRGTATLLCLLLLPLGTPASAAARAAEADAALEQRIAPGQRIATGDAVLQRGHVDVGPRFVNGRWTLMIHDDEARAQDGAPARPNVWRHPERTVLRVTDDAILRVPDDRAYAFIPAKPGTPVHVVPQTQNPDVVWLGWNTQDPTVMEEIDRGVTMTLTDVQGPGALVVYLQSGDFAAPQVLWDSTAKAKPIFVDVDTHSHANWVFTKPGVYQAQIRVSADLVDGTTVSDTRQLRFAVGSRTSVAKAASAPWAGQPATREVADDEPAAAAADSSGSGSLAPVAGLAALAVVLGAGLAAVVLRGRRARRRARAGAPDGSS